MRSGAGGCGVDIVELKRFQRFLSHCDTSQLETVFSGPEIAYCRSRRSPVRSFAGRFAVKEACLKLFPREAALKELDFSDFEVVVDNYGSPRVRITDKLARLLDRNGLEGISVSLSHTATLACGMAVVR